MDPVPYAHLETFLAVARARSFSGAARQLAVSRSAVSQSVRALESRLGVTLVNRTTRSVALTEAGQRLLASTGPLVAQTAAALVEAAAAPGETVGHLRLSVLRAAVPMVLEPVLPVFRQRHPRVEVEVVVDDRFVDVVADGFDAGVRLAEAIQRDMVSVRVTSAFRFVVVGAPAYLRRRGRPERPRDLLEHECVTFRMQSTGALYAWELERGRKTYRIPVRGGVITNDGLTAVALAARGLGLAYTPEPRVAEQVRRGELEIVLESYAPTVPGYFLYFPSRTRRSAPLRLFAELARELLA